MLPTCAVQNPALPKNLVYDTLILLGLEEYLLIAIEALGENASPDEVAHEILKRRLQFSAMATLAQATRVFQTEPVRSMLGISRSTFYRRRHSGEGELSHPQTASLYRFAEVVSMAREFFLTPEATDTWLETRNRFLGNKAPIDLMLTPPGADRVRDYLIKIDTGTYV